MSLVTGTTAVFGDTHPNPRGYLYPEAIRPHPQPTAGEGREGGGGGGGCAVVEAATPVLDGTAPLLCFFRLFHGIAHGSRGAPYAKTRDEKFKFKSGV